MVGALPWTTLTRGIFIVPDQFPMMSFSRVSNIFLFGNKRSTNPVQSHPKDTPDASSFFGAKALIMGED
jgi:hypothetical protein